MNNRDEIIIDKLIESYEKDTGFFDIDCSIKFPERNHDFKEIALFNQIFFPNFWNLPEICKKRKLLKEKIDKLKKILRKNIFPDIKDEIKTKEIVRNIIKKLPEIRDKLKKDVEAAYNGDPAAKNYIEIIRYYPGFKAILVHRIAYELYKSEVYSYSRELSEQTHSGSGIDIHPGAEIGESFFIDHGSGVVIGETTQIGNSVRIYQGVTLGALSLSEDEIKRLRKEMIKRHPTVEDNVIIYAGATILGGKTIIGKGSVIGGNAWITKSIPAHTKIFSEELSNQKIKFHKK